MSEFCLTSLFHDLELPDEAIRLAVKDITLDSRNVSKDSVFFALPGSAINREIFIEQAFESGAIAVVRNCNEQDVDASFYYHEHHRNKLVILVPQLKSRLGHYAARFFGNPSRRVCLVGVTGTNGKTSCADLLVQLWRNLGFTAASLGTLGWSVAEGEYCHTGLTTLDAIENQRRMRFFADKGVTHVVMEVSSHGIDQGRVEGLQFNAKLLTNISRDHLDYHGSMQAYATTKLSFVLCENSVSIVNVDCGEIAKGIQGIERQKYVSISCDSEHANYFTCEAEFLNHGIVTKLQTPGGLRSVESRLIGKFNLYNLLLVSAALFETTEVDSDAYVMAVKKLQPVPGRLESVVGNKTVFIDYAHTPDALENVLVALANHVRENMLLVFGCGGDRDSGKRPLMAQVAEKYAQRIYVTSDNPRSESAEKIIDDVMAGFCSQENVVRICDRAKAIEVAIKEAGVSDIVLIAGKGHETYQEINGVKHPFSDFDEVRRLIA